MFGREGFGGRMFGDGCLFSAARAQRIQKIQGDQKIKILVTWILEFRLGFWESVLLFI